MLVGICGKAGSGKGAASDYLVEKYKFKKISLADPLKRLVKDVFVLDDHTVYDREAREQPIEQWGGWSVRKLLQFIGTELFRDKIDDRVWVKSLWHRIKEDKDNNNYVVDDIRFPNEIKFFEDNIREDFVSLKVQRSGFDGHVGIRAHPIRAFLLKLIGKDIRHSSEIYDLETDYTINNSGSFEDLYSRIDQIMEEVL